jgi:hypothetical protein
MTLALFFKLIVILLWKFFKQLEIVNYFLDLYNIFMFKIISKKYPSHKKIIEQKTIYEFKPGMFLGSVCYFFSL